MHRWSVYLQHVPQPIPPAPQILPSANMNFLALYLHFCIRNLPLASPLVGMYMSGLSNTVIYSVCVSAREHTDTCMCEYECIHATVCYESQRKLNRSGFPPSISCSAD